MFTSFSWGGGRDSSSNFEVATIYHNFLLMVFPESTIEVVNVEEDLKLKTCMNLLAWVAFLP